jgi:N-sulfoglucosamine sulfohydrolase
VVAVGKVAHYAQVTGYGFDHASHFKYHEDECVAEAVKWLEKRKSDKPLCLLVGTNWPHVPWPKEATVTAKGVPPTLVDTPETREARGKYLTAVANADRDLGLMYDAAKKHLGDDVLFAFTADHGSQFPFGKWNCYDAGVRTPLLVAWPGKVKANTTTAAMVGWIDLLPTGKADAHRDKVFFTHSGDGKMNQYPIRAVRTADWKYVRNLDPTAEHHTHVDKGNAGADGRNYFDSWAAKAKTDDSAAAVVKRYHTRPAEELFDLTADPLELKNLAADPTHAHRRKAMSNDLDEWMRANGDDGLKTEKALPDPQKK